MHKPTAFETVMPGWTPAAAARSEICQIVRADPPLPWTGSSSATDVESSSGARTISRRNSKGRQPQTHRELASGNGSLGSETTLTAQSSGGPPGIPEPRSMMSPESMGCEARGTWHRERVRRGLRIHGRQVLREERRCKGQSPRR